jgi:hypothetical protein
VSNWSAYLDSPYGELNLEPQKTCFIDLRQVEANLHQILIIKMINIHNMHVHKFQGRHFLRKKLRGAQQRRQGLGSTFLLLFAANHTALCRYLPLTLSLFAAICQ